MPGSDGGGSPTGGVSTPLGAVFPGGAGGSVVGAVVGAGSLGSVTVSLLTVLAVLVGATAGAVWVAGLLATGLLAGVLLASSDTVLTRWAGRSCWPSSDTAVTPPITPAAASAANPTARRLLAVWVT